MRPPSRGPRLPVPTVVPDRVSRRHANRLISIRPSGRCRHQAQTPLAQHAPGELRVPDCRWPRQLSLTAGEIACAKPKPTLSSRIVYSVSGDKCGPAPITRFGRRRITRFGTNLQRRGARHSTRPARLGRTTRRPRRSSESKNEGTTGMNTRPNIIAREPPAVPAVRGDDR
jgi:hypothetical protein